MLLEWATTKGEKSLFASRAHLDISLRCPWLNFEFKIIEKWVVVYSTARGEGYEGGGEAGRSKMACASSKQGQSKNK